MSYVTCPPLLPSAVVFDAEQSRAWIISSVLVFLLDGFVYHTVGLSVKACVQFTALVAMGSDGTTLSRAAGKLFEQVRWMCSNFYQ